MNIRKAITRWLLRPEYDRLRALTDEAVNDWRRVPYLAARNKEELLERLGEGDSRYVDLILRQLQYSQIGSNDAATESYRLSVVNQSRSLYLTDPTVSFAISLWTSYAFSENPSITTPDKDAQAAWTELVTADRNAPVFSERELHRLSEMELSDGELFL